MRRYKFLARMLWRNLYLAIAGWWEWVSCDLDEYYCCDGTPQRECGCGGITNREAIELQTENYR